MKENKTNEAMYVIASLEGPMDNDVWDGLAVKYGYKNAKSLKDTFKKWEKKQIKSYSESSPPKKETIHVGDITDVFKKDVEKGITVDEALEKYCISYQGLENIIEKVRRSGLNILRAKDKIYLSKTVIQKDNVLEKKWNGTKTITFGIVSDTHIGSKYQQLTLLNKLYDQFEQFCVEDVYLPGDISEGIKMRPGHEQECFLHGSDDIEDYIIDKYPKRNGVTTHFITGNHDHSIIKLSGHDIGIKIAEKRKDMNYLGMSNAKVYLTPNCTMELNHPLDGAAYALSYSIQKLADSLSGGEKPNILINGHHHKALYLFYRNIHMLEAACMQAQSPWMKGKRISAHVGGFIITVEVGETGEIKRFLPEFIPFYEMEKNDY